jgi:hypothetical protein
MLHLDYREDEEAFPSRFPQQLHLLQNSGIDKTIYTSLTLMIKAPFFSIFPESFNRSRILSGQKSIFLYDYKQTSVSSKTENSLRIKQVMI